MNLKETIRILVLKNNVINRLTLYCRRIIFFYDYFQLKKRKKFEIWEIKKLSEELKNTSIEWCLDASNFGIGYSLRKYIDNIKVKNYYLEHGLFFGEFIHKDTLYINTDYFLVQSPYRKEVLERKFKSKKITEIGSYISYAEDYYSEEKIKLLKKKFGKTLVVFPSHSTSEITSEYDKENLIKEILSMKLKYGFKTVIICLFYKDIQRNENMEYKKNNFLVVTAGHRFDNNFLSRLKSIIKISDMTMSNNIGSHIGYCLALGKAHYIYKQEIEVKSTEQLKSLEEWKKRFTKEEWEILDKEKNEIYNSFKEYSEFISTKQFEIGEYYFGIKSKKSIDEMKKIIGGQVC